MIMVHKSELSFYEHSLRGIIALVQRRPKWGDLQRKKEDEVSQPKQRQPGKKKKETG